MPWPLVLFPVAAGTLICCTRRASRSTLTITATVVLSVTLGLACSAASTRPAADYTWGAGLVLHLSVDRVAAVVAVLVPTIALPVTVFAVVHEPAQGLARLVGMLVAFVGAMELLVVAGDLLSLTIGWGLVTGASWVLIAHEWRDVSKPAAAAHAFNATRFGELGLFVAAGAVFASTGSLRYDAIGRTHGALLDAVVIGVLLAAVSKSAQLPFSPWLFSAMAGPSPVSALLHSATMVAAGAYVVVRLHPLLERVSWFAPVTIGVGLTTAIAGGIVALLQDHPKKLLAASTSAHYGLMFVAVGAGFPAAGLAHLVTHAAFKALLFLAAGVAIAAVGSEQLRRMRLGRQLPVIAVLSAIGALALGGVPPLGGGWTKEQIVSAAGHHSWWLAAATIAAGFLSAAYATRFQFRAFGTDPDPGRSLLRRPSKPETGAIVLLAVATVGLGVLWIPGADRLLTDITGLSLASAASWEVAASLGAIAVAIYAVFVHERSHRDAYEPTRASLVAAEWFGVASLTRLAIVDPLLSLSRACATFDARVVDGGVNFTGRAAAAVARRTASLDDRVVDAGIRGVAALSRAASTASSRVGELGFDGMITGLAGLFGDAGRDTRRLQTGRTHQYYVIVAVGLIGLVVAAAVWR